jgi:hypothetical protein
MKAYGLGFAVNPLAVTCPKCARPAGKQCGIKAEARTAKASNGAIKKGDWIGESKRVHFERATAAIDAKKEAR